jgi:hypothetical protein
VAVACKRDLTSGIVDSYPLPVLGILNERPYGPCINTVFDLQKVTDAIRHFVVPEYDSYQHKGPKEQEKVKGQTV